MSGQHVCSFPYEETKVRSVTVNIHAIIVRAVEDQRSVSIVALWQCHRPRRFSLLTEAQGRPLETAQPSMVRADLLEPGGPLSAVSDEAKRYSYSRRSALAHSFGYFEDSSCNTCIAPASGALTRFLTVGAASVDATDQVSLSSGTLRVMVTAMAAKQWHLISISFSLPSTVSAVVDRKSTVDCARRRVRRSDLRVSAYTAHFLPSPSHTVDSIGGVSLTDIRNTCSNVGDSLAQACLSLDWEGSLVRVQYTLFLALRFSHLSRQLDRVPFLPDGIVADALPWLCLVPDTSANASAPEIFTERLMQVHLGRFWRRFGPRRKFEYDPLEAEQRYDRFCAEYLPTLSPEFALEPDSQWDAILPKLPMQRQLMHTAIFDSICWNFRLLLILKPTQIARLAPYK
ncbi:hypothetical protein AN5071.2 [Aspergillus nidulans FGSC A4]|uniref:Uncharacterized protein n=1 Tax=Emericella nidulans (strain FGSC A4 / ATCC 38163 / CBS 112.46 / NRRL 194 / M139) TaxID=227321 RepID=Q5B309_EMENI|nr:hypothetical protein [Aspergillus nidulans FGSC A4]EAA60166.1 hypothetical protein AN5071.2 [Aspergillus nidulans FGSC A4]CBF76151.1 TPA: conserved hypothetical protein [Aspergillus nidulans FGSC A4]|eukprot:XP_662675.1 hypothetical protein AN5071.2 [Aspergillus nidulans FGSC A4]